MAKAMAPLALALCLAAMAHASGATRTLAQSAAPPNPAFGGPATPLDASIQPPAGATVRVNWHAVGTQNYSSASTSKYAPAGAVADFYTQGGTTIVGGHYFILSSGSLTPVFTKTDTSGNVQGTVVARPVAQQPAPAFNNDGGWGSIPYLLLQADSADGFFQGVTHVQRFNTLGGVVPGLPQTFTLPQSPSGIANELLAVPYQADYIFFTS